MPIATANEAIHPRLRGCAAEPTPSGPRISVGNDDRLQADRVIGPYDVERAGEVMGRLNKQLGDWAGTTFKQCNKGAHDGFDGDLLDLVKRSGHLIDQLRNLR